MENIGRKGCFLVFEKDYENVMLPGGFRTDSALYLSNFFPQYS